MIEISAQDGQGSLSELEFETITNYLVRESIEIINDELEYFCHTQENSIDRMLEEVSLGNLKLKALRNKLNNVLYTKEEVKLLVYKIEKQINKVIRMAKWDCHLSFNLKLISWIEPGEVVYQLQEEVKTMFYSAAMSRAIDTAWVKLKKQYMPTGFNKLSAKFKISDLVLSTVQLDNKNVNNNIKAKMARLLSGSIKQYNSQLRIELTEQVIQQIYAKEALESDNIALYEMQTA